jgi:hypothetical protein
MAAFDDFYFNPQMYDPAGGLLGNLHTWAQPPFLPKSISPEIGAAVSQGPIGPPAPAMAGQGPSATLPAAAPLGFLPPQQPMSVLDRIGQGLNNNGLSLLALGAGIAQGGLGKGLELAAHAGLQEAQLGQKRAGTQSTYQALLQAGIPVALAQTIAQSQNPQLMRFALDRYGR